MEPSFQDRRQGRSAWRECGAGPPVVFLHGLGGTRESWNPQLAMLGADHRCMAWDMPGYGEAEPEAELTFPILADRVVEFLDDAGVDPDRPVDLVGLSFGGMHALHTALRHPQRVRRLVLADTSPAFGLDGTTAEGWKRARLQPLDRGSTPAGMAAEVLDAIAGRPLAPDIRIDLIAGFARIPTDGLRAAVQCLPDHDLRGRLAEIEQEALVIVGELDTETPVAYAEALAAGLPRARLEIMAGVGHLSPSEDPVTFNRLVLEFLAQPDPAGDPTPHNRENTH